MMTQFSGISDSAARRGGELHFSHSRRIFDRDPVRTSTKLEVLASAGTRNGRTGRSQMLGLSSSFSFACTRKQTSSRPHRQTKTRARRETHDKNRDTKTIRSLSTPVGKAKQSKYIQCTLNALTQPLGNVPTGWGSV